MPARSFPALPVSGLPRAAARLPRRLTKPVWVLGLALIAALAVVGGRALTANSSSSASVLTPGIQLAVGTLNLEGTAQAVDATQAARLLPLWELLAQLNTSSSAAHEEITAVVEEIKLNMTASQISAIDTMPASDFSLAAAAGSPAASSASTGTRSTAASFSAAANPMLGADMGGAPLDGGGGPMPSGSAQSASSTKTTSAVAGPIQQVIDLLKSKLQG